MKIVLKRSVSLLIGSMLIAAMFMSSLQVTAYTEEAAYIMADDCDSSYYWAAQMGNPVVSIDNKDKMQGEGSMFLDLPSQYTIPIEPFSMMMFLTLEEPIDVSSMKYCEFFAKNSVDFVEGSGYQVNLVDLDTQYGADGYNTVIKEDNLAAGWHRINFIIEDAEIKMPDAVTTNIGAIRFSWLNTPYYECDFKIDGFIFYNEEFLDARTAEEARVKALVDTLSVPTQENYKSEKDVIFAVVNQVEEAKESYPNFMIENQAALDSVLDAYNGFAMADGIKAVEDLISAIGDVTPENYTDKLTAIEAAETGLANLKNVYGDAAVVSNGSVLNTARTAYNGFKKVADDKAAADSVTALIKDLPSVEALAVDDEAEVTAARTAYNALSADQKGYVTEETVNILKAAEEHMYKLLHPYILGDIDENGTVTAADALLALQHSVKKITLEGNKFLAADVDGTGDVTAADALAILQYSVIKITEWPVDNNK